MIGHTFILELAIGAIRIWVLDDYRFGRAADGHTELIEEANVAKHHEPIAGPVLHEADPGPPLPPLAILVLLGVGGVQTGIGSVQTQVDRLVPGPHLTDPEPMGAFALIVLEIDPELLGEQATHESQISATSLDSSSSCRWRSVG